MPASGTPWDSGQECLVGLAGPENRQEVRGISGLPAQTGGQTRPERQTDLCTMAATSSRKITPVLPPGRAQHP